MLHTGCVSARERERETSAHTWRRVRGKVQARENERFERDCQNVAGGNVSGEVERSQTEPEQEVEAIISVCESPRVAPRDVTGSPSCESCSEDKHSDQHVPTSGLCGEHVVPSSILPPCCAASGPPALPVVGCNDLVAVCGVTLGPCLSIKRVCVCSSPSFQFPFYLRAAESHRRGKKSGCPAILPGNQSNAGANRSNI